MTFKQALKELKAITKTYCALTYKVTVWRDGTEKVDIKAYADGYAWTITYPTFREVLNDMNDRVNSVEDPAIKA